MNEKNINIKIDKEVAEGEYANLVLTVHSSSEFIFDFAKLLPGITEANIHTRIIMTPAHAKMFYKSLKDSIEKYEQHFGEIKIEEDLKQKNIGFNKNND
ncbi:MAG: DUF3467 domain-containing protein [candidate division WOR-3 bacterium]